jgi:hypothetical protein
MKRQWWRWAYLIVGGSGVLLYGLGEARGWETGTAAREPAGPTAQRTGGYRTWVYWHGGYRRGK